MQFNTFLVIKKQILNKFKYVVHFFQFCMNCVQSQLSSVMHTTQSPTPTWWEVRRVFSNLLSWVPWHWCRNYSMVATCICCAELSLNTMGPVSSPGSSRGCHEDATRKRVTWNSSFTKQLSTKQTKQETLLLQRDCARLLSVEILQLQNISLENPIVDHYLRLAVLIQYRNVTDTHTDRWTDTRRHIPHLA